MSNSKKWEAFLGPVKAKKQTRRPKDNFDTKTISSIPCLARDLAQMLNPKVIVDEKELKDYKDRKRKANKETTKHQVLKIQRVNTQPKVEPVDTNFVGCVDSDTTCTADKSIASMSPDLLSGKVENSESLFPSSASGDRQVKTEAVDEIGDSGENAIIIESDEENEVVEEEEALPNEVTVLFKSDDNSRSMSPVSLPDDGQGKTEVENVNWVSSNNDDVMANESSLSPDKIKQFEVKDNIDEDETLSHRERKLLRKGETSESLSPRSPVDRQVKSESVDESGDDWEMDDVIAIGSESDQGEEEETLQNEVTDLFRSADNSRSMSPVSSPVGGQVKTEVVDKSENSEENDDVLKKTSVSSMSSDLTQELKEKEIVEEEETKFDDLSGGSSNEDEKMDNESISSLSPDPTQQFEVIDNIDEDETLLHRERKLLGKGETSESLSPRSPVGRQVKTESVDESGDVLENDDVMTIESESDQEEEEETLQNIQAQQFEEIENVDEEGTFSHRERKLLGKGENSASPTSSSSVDREAKTEPVDGNGDDGEKDDVKSIESKSPIRTDLTQELKEIVEDKDTQLYKESKLLRRDHNEIPFPIAHRHVTPEAVGKSLAGGNSKPTLVEILSSEIPADYPGSITSVSPKDKPGVRQTKTVDHRSTSVSKWTFKMFADNITFDDYVHELRFCGQTTGEEDLDLNVLFDDILGMFGSNSLKDCMLRENESRVLLDGILMKLCKEHKLRVQMEYQCNMQYLPTGKLDYLITTRDGVPLGCIEAKSPAGFEKKSFCQAVLELILVQDLAAKKDVDVEKTPVFCILSDGYRYILMQLKGRELLLEHDIPKHRRLAPTIPKVIKLRKLDEQDDFKKLITSITTLITDSMCSA